MEVFIFMRIKSIDPAIDKSTSSRRLPSRRRPGRLETKPTQLVASQLTLKLLGDDASLALSFARFDAAKAECRYDRDRQRLLAVIEASFGTAAHFNQVVLEVLNKQVLDGNTLASLSA